MKQCSDNKKELRAISQTLGHVKKNALAHARTCLQAAPPAQQQEFYTEDHFLQIYFFGYFNELLLLGDAEAHLGAVTEPSSSDFSVTWSCIKSSAMQYFEQQQHQSASKYDLK
jgi:hypothetical protein